MASSWKSLSGVPSFSPDTMLLMTDGNGIGARCRREGLASAEAGRQRQVRYGRRGLVGAVSHGQYQQFYASGVLTDGRVFVLGGEYSSAVTIRRWERFSIRRATPGRR